MLTSAYYLLSIFSVIMSLFAISAIKESREIYERISVIKKRNVKSDSTREINKLTNKYRVINPQNWSLYIFSKLVLTMHFIWLFFGLITPQWWIFIAILTSMILLKSIYNNRFPNKSRSVINIIIMIIYVFLIINHFNLGIDLSFSSFLSIL